VGAFSHKFSITPSVETDQIP